MLEVSYLDRAQPEKGLPGLVANQMLIKHKQQQQLCYNGSSSWVANLPTKSLIKS